MSEGTIVASGLTLGVAASGSVVAKTGGKARIFESDYQARVPFTVQEVFNTPFDRHAGCRSDKSKLKDYVRVEARYDGAPSDFPISVQQHKAAQISAGDRFEFKKPDPQPCRDEIPGTLPVVVSSFAPV